MPTMVERAGGRRRDGNIAAREFFIHDAETEDEARDFLIANAPATLEELPLLPGRCNAEEIEGMVRESGGTTSWIGVAAYGVEGFGFQPVDDFDISFDIATESVHITHSKATVGAFAPAAETAPDFKQAINVQFDGTVEGCDIQVAHLGYEVTYTFDQNAINQAYILILYLIVGTVNNASFHGFASGELFLARVHGQRRSDNAWNITFAFLTLPNATDIVIGDITVTTKKGWDYLWVYFVPANDVAAHAIVMQPRFAYVERVYDYTNYDNLGI